MAGVGKGFIMTQKLFNQIRKDIREKGQVQQATLDELGVARNDDGRVCLILGDEGANPVPATGLIYLEEYILALAKAPIDELLDTYIKLSKEVPKTVLNKAKSLLKDYDDTGIAALFAKYEKDIQIREAKEAKIRNYNKIWEGMENCTAGTPEYETVKKLIIVSKSKK